MKYHSIWFLILLALLPCFAFAQSDKIAENNSQAIVSIASYDDKDKLLNQGSGIVVRNDGVILTNLHIVTGAKLIKITLGKDKSFDLEGVIALDETNNLVILKVKGENIPVVTLGDSDKIKQSQKVILLGPNNVSSNGTINMVKSFIQNNNIIWLNVTFPSSLSGSAVLNELGEVIGIITIISKDASNINFAIPINSIKVKLGEKKVSPIDAIIGKNYSSSAEYNFLKGFVFNDTGKYKEAISAYEQAIISNPTKIEAHYNLAFIYERFNDWDKAIELFKQALKVKPDFVDACYNIGVAYANKGNTNKAIEYYQKTVEIKPDYAAAYCAMGFAHVSSGDHKSAIDSYQKAIKANPEYFDAYFNLGIAFGEASYYKQAIECFKKSIQLRPEDAQAHYSLGFAYEKATNYKLAAESFKEAVRLNPSDAMSHFALGNAYFVTGNNEGAIAELKILETLDKQLADDLSKIINGK
jgi:tetratricopeptide (TPR) repeat protein